MSRSNAIEPKPKYVSSNPLTNTSNTNISNNNSGKTPSPQLIKSNPDEKNIFNKFKSIESKSNELKLNESKLNLPRSNNINKSNEYRPSNNINRSGGSNFSNGKSLTFYDLTKGFIVIHERDWTKIPIGSLIRYVKLNGDKIRGGYILHKLSKEENGEIFGFCISENGEEKDEYYAILSEIKIIYKKPMPELEFAMITSRIDDVLTAIASLEKKLIDLEKNGFNEEYFRQQTKINNLVKELYSKYNK